MGALAAITVVLAALPGFRPAPAPAQALVAYAPTAFALRAGPPSAGPVAPMASDRPARSGPACLGDVCQPVVSVPGFEPRWRKGRNELALALLERADIQPISSLAALVARSGVLLDFSPPVLDAGARHGWGRLLVGFRWKLGSPREP